MTRSSYLFWICTFTIALVAALSLPAVSRGQAAGTWKAPSSADDQKNPVPSDAKSVAAGKTVYLANCMACHGMGGKGDGPAAAALGPDHKPGDLTSAKTQQQSDGSMFWKITEGRKPMPAFGKLLNETQRWEVINYVRTLASGK